MGTSSDGKIENTGGNTFVVRGTHTYQDAGTWPVRVEYLDQANRIDFMTTVLIDAPALNGTARDLSASIAGELKDLVVAEFESESASLPIWLAESARTSTPLRSVKTYTRVTTTTSRPTAMEPPSPKLGNTTGEPAC